MCFTGKCNETNGIETTSLFKGYSQESSGNGALMHCCTHHLEHCHWHRRRSILGAMLWSLTPGVANSSDATAPWKPEWRDLSGWTWNVGSCAFYVPNIILSSQFFCVVRTAKNSGKRRNSQVSRSAASMNADSVHKRLCVLRCLLSKYAHFTWAKQLHLGLLRESCCIIYL